MRIFFIIFFTILSLYGVEIIEPTKSLNASGDIEDMVVRDGSIFVATSKGAVDIFDLHKKEKIESIKIPKIEDFFGDIMDAKIYSVDSIGGRVIFASEGDGGYRKIWLYEEPKLSLILDEKSKYLVKKIRFVDKNRVVFALLSNELVLFDLDKNSTIYRTQIGTSSFSDFVLSEDRFMLISSDESGIVRVVDVTNGEVIKTHKGLNVDRVFQLDYKDGVILTAGQDRRAGIYRDSSSYYLEFDFLLYSGSLSSDAKRAAVAYNQKSDILIFDTSNKNRIYYLVGSKGVITKIIFLDKNNIIASSSDGKINYWKLKN